MQIIWVTFQRQTYGNRFTCSIVWKTFKSVSVDFCYCIGSLFDLSTNVPTPGLRSVCACVGT